MVTIDDAGMAAKWERLASRETREACRASGARWDGERRVYLVDMLDDTLEVSVENRSVGWAARSAPRQPRDPKRDTALLVLEYLVNARDVPPSGRWVTPQQLPSGDFFFRGPHEVPTQLLVRCFGDSPRRFLEKAALLGEAAAAVKDVPGDAAVRFRVFPKIDVLIQLWGADDEFPARASILFDSSIREHLLVDAVFLVAMVLVLELIRR